MLSLLTPDGKVRQWTLVQGEARCLLDPLDPLDANAGSAYGRSLYIKGLLELDAAYPPAPPTPAEGEEPDPEWTPPEIDADVAALRRIRSGEATDEDRDLIEAFLDEAPPVQIPSPVPEKVTNYQAREALIRAGLFSAVDTWVHTKAPNDSVRQAWEYANEFYRNGELLTQAGAQFGLTDPMLDDLFRVAGSIKT
jgi:hypothetical protein